MRLAEPHGLQDAVAVSPRRCVVAAAAIAVALAAGAAAARSSSPTADKPKQIWVGTLRLSYFRHFESVKPHGTAVEKSSRTLVITNKKDGTAVATGSIRTTTSFPCSNGSASGRVEVWNIRAKVKPLRVTFVKERYQIEYPNPSSKVTIEELECTGRRSRVVGAFAMNVGFQLYGRASPSATRIAGEWKNLPACEGTCISYEWSGRWDLRRVAVAGGDTDGDGSGGSDTGAGSSGGGGPAGSGCDARTRNGTTGDDVLRGTAAAELIRGLAGDDRIAALAGADCLRGGAGDDLLQGGLGRDLLVGDAGTDVLDGGPGNDELRARDGRAETVHCGAGGADVAIVDASDRVSGCETVRR